MAKAPPPGRRELNKIDKERRIKAAARAVFLSKGYDEATMRAIATRAGVALGTLFIYATHKRDLLFLVVNDDFERLAREAAAAIGPKASLIENLIAAFEPLYGFFARHPELSRLVLREMFFYDSGMQATRFAATRMQMIAAVTEALRIAEARNEVTIAAGAGRAGRVVFSVYQLEVRLWLEHESPDVEAGLRALAQALALLIGGLAPRPSALALSAARRHLLRSGDLR